MVFGHAKLSVAPALLQQCWHMLSAKSHFSSADKTKMKSDSPCLALQAKQAWKIMMRYFCTAVLEHKGRQTALLLSCFLWDNGGRAYTTLPRWTGTEQPQPAPTCSLHPAWGGVVTARNPSCLMSFPSGIPPTGPFRRQGDCEQSWKTEDGSGLSYSASRCRS